MFAVPSAAGRALALGLLLVLVAPAAPTAADDTSPPDSQITQLIQLIQLGSDDRPTRQTALKQLSRSRDGRLVEFFKAYQQGDAYLYQGRVVLCPKFQETDGRKLAPLLDPLTARPWYR